MRVIFGFGQHHADLTSDKLNAISDTLRKFIESRKNHDDYRLSDIKNILDTLVGQEELFNNKWNPLFFQTIFGDTTMWSVAGRHSHYRDDHPASPDGFASLSIPFCITVRDLRYSHSDVLFGDEVEIWLAKGE